MKTITLQLTQFEIDALSIPIYVNLENARLELNQAVASNREAPVLDWLDARCEALDKLMQALNDAK